MSFRVLQPVSVVILALGILATSISTCEARKSETLAQSILPVKKVTIRTDGSIQTVWDNIRDQEGSYVLRVFDDTGNDVTASFGPGELETLLFEAERVKKPDHKGVMVFYKAADSGLEEIRTRS